MLAALERVEAMKQRLQVQESVWIPLVSPHNLDLPATDHGFIGACYRQSTVVDRSNPPFYQYGVVGRIYDILITRSLLHS